MALKIVRICQECANDCKQEVHDTVWENAEVLQCPNGNKFKRKKTNKKK